MNHALDNVQVTLPDLWATHAEFYPDKEAVVCGATRRTWRDFNANMNRVANGLIGAGIQKGDRVAVCMGNSVEMLETTFGGCSGRGMRRALVRIADGGTAGRSDR